MPSFREQTKDGYKALKKKLEQLARVDKSFTKHVKQLHVYERNEENYQGNGRGASDFGNFKCDTLRTRNGRIVIFLYIERPISISVNISQRAPKIHCLSFKIQSFSTF